MLDPAELGLSKNATATERVAAAKAQTATKHKPLSKAQQAAAAQISARKTD